MDRNSGGDEGCFLANRGKNETKSLNQLSYSGTTDQWTSVILTCGCKEATEEKPQPTGFFLNWHFFTDIKDSKNLP